MTAALDILKPDVNPLGRIKVHDEKSREHQFVRKAEKGRSVRHALRAPNVDQFYLGACVGFSGTNLLNTAPAAKSRDKFNLVINGQKRNLLLGNNDGIKNYSESTKRDPFEGEYPPVDDGSSALGLMKFWQEFGIIKEYQWVIDGGFDSVIAAIQQGPVLFGTWWYEGLGDPDSKGLVHPTGDQIGGHEFCANAYLYNTLPSKRLIGYEQSWGEEWGVKGKFYIPCEEAEALWRDGGDIAVPILL